MRLNVHAGCLNLKGFYASTLYQFLSNYNFNKNKFQESKFNMLEEKSRPHTKVKVAFNLAEHKV